MFLLDNLNGQRSLYRKYESNSSEVESRVQRLEPYGSSKLIYNIKTAIFL